MFLFTRRKLVQAFGEVMNGIWLRVHLKIAWSKIPCLIITSKKKLAIQGYPLCLDAPFFSFLVRRPFHPHGSLHGFFGTSTYFESHCLRRVTIGTKHSTHVGFTNFLHVWQILRGHHFWHPDRKFRGFWQHQFVVTCSQYSWLRKWMAILAILVSWAFKIRSPCFKKNIIYIYK